MRSDLSGPILGLNPLNDSPRVRNRIGNWRHIRKRILGTVATFLAAKIDAQTAMIADFLGSSTERR